MRSEFIVAALAAAAAARPAPQGVTEQIAPPAPIPSTCAVNFAGKFGIAVITDIRGRQVQPAATPEAAAMAGPPMAGPPMPPPGMPLDKRMAQPQVTAAPAAPGAGSDSTVTVRSTRTHTRTVTVRPIRATAAPVAPAGRLPELPMPDVAPALDTYTGPHVKLLMVSQIADGQIQAPITPVPVPIPAPMPLPTAGPSGARTVTQIPDGQIQAPMDTRPPTGLPAGAAPTPPAGPMADPMMGPPPAGPMPGGPMPGGPLPAGALPPPGAMPGGPMGPPPEGMSLGLAGGPPAAGGPVGGPSPAAGGLSGGFPGLGPAGPGPMGDGMSLGLAGAGGAQLPPAGATVNRMELDGLESSYPAEGSEMGINRAMLGADAGPGTLAACLTNGTLALTLNNGILKDNKGRTGYIASNRQFQFDDPPQHGSLYTAGFSVCSNGSLALGGSAVWWQCLSGNFYNLYDQWIAPQCHPIHISTIKLNQC